MNKIINIICVMLVLGAATITYTIKHEAEARLSDIRQLERDVEANSEMIEILNADWAFLTQPARIQRLVEQFGDTLELDVTAAHQLVGFDALPGAPVRDASQGIEDIIAQDGLDLLTTGSVEGEDQ